MSVCVRQCISGRRMRRAREPDGDAQAEMYEWSQGRMAEAGYRQYEISNWSLPGQECRHNLVYWRNGAWLAEFGRRFGPGADDASAATFEELASLGLLERANGRLRLTDRGRLLANEV